MSRPVPQPTDDQVHAALARLSAAGPPVTVTALARELGLTNPTFWRHFPDLARSVVDKGRTGHQNSAAADPARLARVLRDNRQLQHDLLQATANIARLTLENHQLRRDLEVATGVRSLTPKEATHDRPTLS